MFQLPQVRLTLDGLGYGIKILILGLFCHTARQGKFHISLRIHFFVAENI